MAYLCFHCGKDSGVSSPTQVARKDVCPHCDRDLHVCMNCVHYDTSAYNQCREPQAERQVDKDCSNFCDFFSYRSGTASAGNSGAKEPTSVKKNLDALFGK